MATVLVVEDDRDILTAIHETLTEQGWDVVDASSVREAMHAVKTHSIDVVLCDVVLHGRPEGLPLRDGFGRHGFGHVPFTFMTASTEEMARLKGEPVLRKPFGLSDVVAFLSSAVHCQ